MKQKKECPICGEEKRYINAKTCSVECSIIQKKQNHKPKPKGKCPICEKEKNNSYHKTCSSECGKELKGQKIKKRNEGKKIGNCIVCGNEKKHKQAKTCGYECNAILIKQRTRELRNCKMCNKEFEERKKYERSFCCESCRLEWKLIPENKEDRIQKALEGVQKKYGKDIRSTAQLPFVVEKMKVTKLEKYGDENYVNPKRAKETKLEKYGDENYNNHEKNSNTKLERYGDESYSNREKAKETMIERYGVEYSMQLEEFRIKLCETSFKKYGTKYPMQNEELLKKKEETNLEKYGFKTASSSPIVKEKIKKSHLNKMKETKYYKLYENLYLTDLKLNDDFVGMFKDVESGVGKKLIEYNFECTKCEHKFISTFSNGKIPICRKCFPVPSNGRYQNEFREFFQSNGINNFVEGDRKVIKPLELDFYFEEQKIAIEINGNYWHSEISGEKGKNYHLNKTILCREHGVRLIHIFEDEILNNREVVYSKIMSILKKDSKTTIKSIDCDISFNIKKSDIDSFLLENDLNGISKREKVNIGLFNGGEMVSYLSLRKMGEEYYIGRHSDNKHLSVEDSFKTMIKAFIDKFNPKKIYVYDDLRYEEFIENKSLYLECGFKFQKRLRPQFWYLKMKGYGNRIFYGNLSKKILKKMIGDKYQDWMSDFDIAQILGYDRIWDCGRMVYVYES